MLEGEVLRGRSTNDGTPGRLTLANGFECETLELPWKNNRTGESCTLADVFRASLWRSPKLGSPFRKMVPGIDGEKFDLYHMVYRFEDAHGRKDCLIHNANFAGNVGVGEETQIHGCTAVGSGYGFLKNHAGVMQRAILGSVLTLERLIIAAAGEDLEITYRWADGCEPDDLTDEQEG